MNRGRGSWVRSLSTVEQLHLSASVSFVIGRPDVRGRGYATEAVHSATNHMFSVEGFEKLYGAYYADHRASEKVFSRNGYTEEGRLRKKLVDPGMRGLITFMPVSCGTSSSRIEKYLGVSGE